MKKTAITSFELIDWIHPSCRDLSIEELAENSDDRHRFLTNCSENGLLLATSIGGGAEGLRHLPLLQTDNDWGLFTTRSEQLLLENQGVFRIIWNNFRAMKEQSENDGSTRDDLNRLGEIIKTKLCPVAARRLSQHCYFDPFSSLESEFDKAGSLTQLKSLLGKLTTPRNKAAHTHTFGVLPTIDSPSVVRKDLEALFRHLREMERILKRRRF
ncbi:MAG TPA: hypothetical protein VNV43_10975 [Candidatus Acidoferrales bacterium]|nr:hypothetical protein [Candidatus Acidoferrales bacterium]